MYLPWKTASQTIAARLGHLNDSPYSRFFAFNPHLNRVVHQHMTCADFLCLPESRLPYLSASFVRNPYDRVYSGFRQIQKDIAQQPAAQFPSPWIRNLVMKQLAENYAQLVKSNNDFDRWVALIEDEQIYEQGRNTNFPLHPAHYWTHIAGKAVVDFVGKVENFDADFKKFTTLADISDAPEINANTVELTTRASSDQTGYRYVDRMGSDSIRKINKLFTDDFDLFNYLRIE